MSSPLATRMMLRSVYAGVALWATLAYSIQYAAAFSAPAPLAFRSAAISRGPAQGVTSLKAQTETLERRLSSKDERMRRMASAVAGAIKIFHSGSVKIPDYVKVVKNIVTGEMELVIADQVEMSANGRCIFDTNALGEHRHHPYFDAPEERLAAAGNLVFDRPPLIPNFDLSMVEAIDYDARMDRAITARGWEMRGKRYAFDTNAFGEDRHHPYFDAPEDRLAAVGNLAVNTTPFTPNFDLSITEIDYDAPIERALAARGCGCGFESRGEGCIRAQLILNNHDSVISKDSTGLVFDTNPLGENRHHPYFDAPESRLAASGHLVLNTLPPTPNFSQLTMDEPDFDAPIQRAIAARGCEHRGENCQVTY